MVDCRILLVFISLFLLFFKKYILGLSSLFLRCWSMRGPLINSTIVLRKWWNPADRLIPSVLIGRRNGGWQEKKVERDPVVESPPQLRPMYLYSRSGCLWAIHQRKYGREKKEKKSKRKRWSAKMYLLFLFSYDTRFDILNETETGRDCGPRLLLLLVLCLARERDPSLWIIANNRRPSVHPGVVATTA